MEYHHHHHHHHISLMELGHLLTRSGLTYPEVSSKVYHDSFCQLGSLWNNKYIIHNTVKTAGSSFVFPFVLPTSA